MKAGTSVAALHNKTTARIVSGFGDVSENGEINENGPANCSQIFRQSGHVTWRVSAQVTEETLTPAVFWTCRR